MTEDSPLRRARENATGIVSMLVTGVWLFGLFTGASWWLPALIVGYVVVVPVTAMLFGDEEDVEDWVWGDTWTGEGERADAEGAMDGTGAGRSRDAGPSGPASQDGSADDALSTLRERYARGELTDEQFERKVERLLETETLEDVEDRARARRTLDGSRAPDPERERER